MRAYGSGVGIAVGSGVFVGSRVGSGDVLVGGCGVTWLDDQPGILQATTPTSNIPSRAAILTLSTMENYNPGDYGCQLHRQFLLIVVNVDHKYTVDLVRKLTPHTMPDYQEFLLSHLPPRNEH